MTALRCQGGAERDAMRAYRPLRADHPCIGMACAVCDRIFVAGDITTAIPLGPGAAPDTQAKALRGGWYSALAIVAHAACGGIQAEVLA
jgi:hypothetical protein